MLMQSEGALKVLETKFTDVELCQVGVVRGIGGGVPGLNFVCPKLDHLQLVVDRREVLRLTTSFTGLLWASSCAFLFLLLPPSHLCWVNRCSLQCRAEEILYFMLLHKISNLLSDCPRQGFIQDYFSGRGKASVHSTPKLGGCGGMPPGKFWNLLPLRRRISLTLIYHIQCSITKLGNSPSFGGSYAQYHDSRGVRISGKAKASQRGEISCPPSPK